MSKIQINLMCCDLPLPKPWLNIDISTSPHIQADLVLDCTKLADYFTPSTVDEIYIGHGLEHLDPDEIEGAMNDWKTVLKPGGILGIVTPDFRYIVEGYLRDDPRFTNFELVDTYIFSYKQESRHRSLHDERSLTELLSRHGFTDIVPIDRMNDPRLAYPAEWQCGVSAKKGES